MCPDTMWPHGTHMRVFRLCGAATELDYYDVSAERKWCDSRSPVLGAYCQLPNNHNGRHQAAPWWGGEEGHTW